METLSLKQSENHSANTVQTKASVKQQDVLRASGGYLANAFREGFKQSFLGYDIDMDFVLISLRSFAHTSGKSIKTLVTKYNALTGHNKRVYHNNTTLSNC
jgi:hypothetical protein